MDKDKKLQDIFENDPLGLLNVKPSTSPARNADERLVASFEEINAFYNKHKREPNQGGGPQEHQLYARLQSLRASSFKMGLLKQYDGYNLLDYVPKEYNSLNDIMDDDILGLLDDGSEGLFDFKHIKKPDDRASADFVARRKPCKDFEKYEPLFKAVQADLKNSERKLIAFKQDNLRAGSFYVHNGILFLVEKIDITIKEHYKPDGTRVREDGRTRCIFENGTESNMLKRSIEKILYANGKAVSENQHTVNAQFAEQFSNVMQEDAEMGFVYILKSKSTDPVIKSLSNLYKIGFSKLPVEERIKNARHEATYLLADVIVVSTYQCFNMNPQKFEQLIHTFFGNACLNVDVFDSDRNRYIPREWFIAPLNVIEQVIDLIMSGKVPAYKYDIKNEEIVKKV